ncbi:hypothetical protein MYMA111404_02295 [Mycoplasma marinum]|uniref:Lipoprotein n=1 Tax=Mycoplasma marinum TaxID=1937190 RepID=A0A4R0XR10_9MOLU|nr:hypothetical protein [Mycoplasma marinum]TCG11325.1 hypothetical protein C4B24_02120 [Mycoplasma marinum]
MKKTKQISLGILSGVSIIAMPLVAIVSCGKYGGNKNISKDFLSGVKTPSSKKPMTKTPAAKKPENTKVVIKKPSSKKPMTKKVDNKIPVVSLKEISLPTVHILVASDIVDAKPVSFIDKNNQTKKSDGSVVLSGEGKLANKLIKQLDVQNTTYIIEHKYTKWISNGSREKHIETSKSLKDLKNLGNSSVITIKYTANQGYKIKGNDILTLDLSSMHLPEVVFNKTYNASNDFNAFIYDLKTGIKKNNFHSEMNAIKDDILYLDMGTYSGDIKFGEFSGSDMKQFIGTNVSNIEDWAFAYQDKLTKIDIRNVGKIGQGAFGKHN